VRITPDPCSIGQRRPLNVVVENRVERDVDASGLLGHGVGMLFDRRLVERIYSGRLGHPSRSADLLGYSFDPC